MFSRLTLTIILVAIISTTLLISCSKGPANIQNVGMILETEIKDHPWNEKGYIGLERIKRAYQVNVYVKENIQTSLEVERAVDDLTSSGVNLIFGHGPTYGKYFSQLSRHYPDTHFVYFNGNFSDVNVTSLNIDPHAIGFFSGMIAGEMTASNEIGMIGAYEWQPELEGFFEGVKYANEDANVHMDFVNNNDEANIALSMYENMAKKDIDVIFPIGDSFSETVIRQATNDGLYAMGYMEDQSYINEHLVLTSTIHHVEDLYEYAARSFERGKLQGGIYTFDFAEEAVSFGQFSDDIPEDVISNVEQAVEMYIELNTLPNEREAY
ncbi:MAG TPA: BMP family ABC transporter substrate-binding protein [Bacillota bacterium]|nr:BMP family ABC transporter substrate-binding protein [Bacillota bacterium]